MTTTYSPPMTQRLTLSTPPVSEKTTTSEKMPTRCAKPLSIIIANTCAENILHIFSISPIQNHYLYLSGTIHTLITWTYYGGLVRRAGACEAAAVGAMTYLARYRVLNPHTRVDTDDAYNLFHAAFFIAGNRLDTKNEVGWWKMFRDFKCALAEPELKRGLGGETDINHTMCEFFWEEVTKKLEEPAELTTSPPSFAPQSQPHPSSKPSLFSRLIRRQPTATTWLTTVHALCK